MSIVFHSRRYGLLSGSNNCEHYSKYAALIRFGFSAPGEPFGPRLVDSSVAKK